MAFRSGGGRRLSTFAVSWSIDFIPSASAGTAWSSRATSPVIDFRLKPHAGRWESGSLNVAGITALGASLELLLEIGIDAVSARVSFS